MGCSNYICVPDTEMWRGPPHFSTDTWSSEWQCVHCWRKFIVRGGFEHAKKTSAVAKTWERTDPCSRKQATKHRVRARP